MLAWNRRYSKLGGTVAIAQRRSAGAAAGRSLRHESDHPGTPGGVIAPDGERPCDPLNRHDRNATRLRSLRLAPAGQLRTSRRNPAPRPSTGGSRQPRRPRAPCVFWIISTRSRRSSTGPSRERPGWIASYRPRDWARRHLTPRRQLARPLGHRQPPTTGGSNSRARRYSLSRSEASNRSLSVTPSIALSAITTIRGVMLRPRSETSNTPAARPRRVARRAVAPAAARPNGRMRGTAPSPVKATPSGPRQAAPRARRDSSRRENHHHRAQHLETRRRGKAGGRAGARRRTARRWRS